MNFNIAGFTNVGTNRTINQDRILANGELIHEGSLNLENQSNCICFVADGVGGNKRGEFASEYVLNALQNEICADFRELTDRLNKVNAQLIETASKDASTQGTATTLTGLYIDVDNFYVFHVGDSELWLFRNNMFSKITTDQIERDLPNSPLISYFGGNENHMFPETEISLDSSEEKDYYLLCSDGLFKSLDSPTVKNVLIQEISVQEKVNVLLESALKNGAPDNISVILIQRHHEIPQNQKKDISFQNNPTGVVSTNFTDSNTGVVSGISSSDKTGVIINTNDKTGIVGDYDSTKKVSTLHSLGIGDTIKLKDRIYEITRIVSEGTGEASVYLVVDEHSIHLALKLYKEFDDPKHEPNPEALSRIKEIHNPDILKLHDYGVGLDKYNGKYCYELSDFAEGGDLQNCSISTGITIEFIEKQLIEEIFLGIKTLHENRIYHCDLKPANIFYLDKDKTDLVIGDYGSAKTFEKDSILDVQSTTTVKGTNVYMAPEQGRGHVSDRNDYYSFGMILLSMVYPNSLKSFRDITVRQLKGIKIIDYDIRYKRINNLIEGLTLNSYEHRFGLKEVEQWLKGEEVKVHYSGDNTIITPVKLGGGKLIENGEDFVGLLDNDKDWYAKYIEEAKDGSIWSKIRFWLIDYMDGEASQRLEGIRKHYESRGVDYLKEAFIRFFEPTRVIQIETITFDFHNTDNLKNEVEKFCNKLDQIWKITDWKILRFYLFQFEFSIRQLTLTEDSVTAKALSDKLLTAFGIQPSNFIDLKTEIHININDRKLDQFYRNLLGLFYAFNPERGFKNKKNQECKTIEELGLFFAKEPNLFNDQFISIEKEVFLRKINSPQLSTLAYKPLVFEIFKNKAQTEIEFVNLTFDKYRDNKLEYKFFKSLNQYLETKNIHTDFTDRAENNLEYRSKRKLFQSFWSYGNHVIIDLSHKHNITTLSEQNKSEFKKKFVLSSLKRYAYIFAGQMIALGILIPTVYLLYMLFYDRISINENWRFYRGSTIPTLVIDTTYIKIGIVNDELPLHEKNNRFSKTLHTFKKGDTLKYLDDSDKKWQKVIYESNVENYTGWVHPTLNGKQRLFLDTMIIVKQHKP